jgi:ribosomal protein S18 acetylase RimI-like enzyme
MSTEIVDADLQNPTHAQGIIEILDSYAREPVGGSRPLSAPVRGRLIPGLRAQPHAELLLALHSGHPVGVAVCFVGFSTFAAKPLLNLHDLAVLPAYRGRGIGRLLLAAVEDRARTRGCCKVTLEVREDNHAARALYKRSGYGDFAPGSESTPTLFLEKNL